MTETFRDYEDFEETTNNTFDDGVIYQAGNSLVDANGTLILALS